MCTIKKKNNTWEFGESQVERRVRRGHHRCVKELHEEDGGGWGASDPCSFGNEQRLQVRAEGPVGSTVLRPQSCCSWWCTGSSGTAMWTGELDNPASRRWVVAEGPPG